MESVVVANVDKVRRIREKRAYICFVVFFYFFIFKDYLETKISVIGYADELLASCAIIIFFVTLVNNNFKLKIVRGGYARYIVLFFIFGLVASIFYSYQNFFKIALPDAFLCVKFWLSIYVGKNIFAHLRVDRYAKRIYRHVKIITLIYIFLMLIDWVFNVFSTDIRYGLRSTQLMYSHSTVLVACCVFIIMVLLMLREYVTGYMKWLVVLLFIMCSTLRSKAWGAAIAIVLICYLVFFRKKKFRIRTLLLFAPLIVALGWEQIEYYFFSSILSDSARYQLLITSIEIAKDHFPLGSGFGTFASYYSAVDYSPLYSMYGISNVNGLIEGSASFVSDSFWPMVIGQTGYVGTIAYVLAVVLLFGAIQKIRKVNISYYAAALSGISYLLIASVAESAFVHPLAIPIAVMIGYFLKMSNSNK